MTSSNLLSREELDALLRAFTGVDTDEWEERGVNPKDKGPGHYGFTRQERTLYSQLPMLELIHHRFVPGFAKHLQQEFHPSARVSIEAMKSLKFRDFLKTCNLPTSFHFVRMLPLQGQILVSFDASLVFVLVDNFFGSRAPVPALAGKQEFTLTELRVIGKTLSMLFEDLKDSWLSLLEVQFRPLSTETNPDFVNQIDPDETLLLTTFDIDFDRRGGQLQIGIPLSTLEPVMNRLNSNFQGSPHARDQEWSQQFQGRIQSVQVEIGGTLGSASVPLRDLLDMKPGDFIPLNMPEQAVLDVEGVPLLWGELGIHNGKNAIKIRGTIDHTGIRSK